MRAFVAIEISADIRRKLAQLQRELEPTTKMLRWAEPEKIHLTLQFLGQVADEKVADITRELESAAQSVSPFELSITGVGAFPSARSLRVLWVGVKDSGQLAHLQQICQSSLSKLGFEPEAREYNPHLTLARAKGEAKIRGMDPIIDAHAGFVAGKMQVREIVLFESKLSPKGATYTPRVRLDLST